jgi:uncharacterized protein YggU (UPF0235/DUF167 family)
LRFRVQPGAKTTEIELLPTGEWKVRLRARPVEGQANAALLAQLADWLDISKSRVTLVRGATSRQKVVAVSGLDEAEALRRLAAMGV